MYIGPHRAVGADPDVCVGLILGAAWRPLPPRAPGGRGCGAAPYVGVVLYMVYARRGPRGCGRGSVMNPSVNRCSTACGSVFILCLWSVARCSVFRCSAACVSVFGTSSWLGVLPSLLPAGSSMHLDLPSLLPALSSLCCSVLLCSATATTSTTVCKKRCSAENCSLNYTS